MMKSKTEMHPNGFGCRFDKEGGFILMTYHSDANESILLEELPLFLYEIYDLFKKKEIILEYIDKCLGENGKHGALEKIRSILNDGR